MPAGRYPSPAGSDVGSTDGTLDILSQYERRGCLRLLRRRDPTAPSSGRARLLEIARRDNPCGCCLFCDAEICAGAIHPKSCGRLHQRWRRVLMLPSP